MQGQTVVEEMVGQDLVKARCVIEKHGYHRRDGELADAEAKIA